MWQLKIKGQYSLEGVFLYGRLEDNSEYGINLILSPILSIVSKSSTGGNFRDFFVKFEGDNFPHIYTAKDEAEEQFLTSVFAAANQGRDALWALSDKLRMQNNV